MELGAIGLDPAEIDARLVRMDDSEIDAEIGDAYLRMDDPALGLERPLHRILERRLRVAAGRREGLGDGARSVLGEFEEVLEIDDPARVGPAKVDLLRVHAGEDDHLAPGTGNLQR